MTANLFYCVLSLSIASIGFPLSLQAADDEFRVGTFEVDASPRIGSMLAYDIATGIQSPLSCRGVVLLTDEKPIVLCAVDWLGLSNEGLQFFKQELAAAANTGPERIAVHALHQHDAPACDFTLEKMLREVGVPNVPFDSESSRLVIKNAAIAVKEAIANAKRVTHLGTSQAPVHLVASNRRIMGPDGKVLHVRWSATKAPDVQAFPEGLIDPNLKMVSFWNEEEPVAVLTYYATHPQSYYRTGLANPDFPGMARNQAQELAGVPHIHFNGAGGNITAGKYNDGEMSKRQVLADRMLGAFRRAFKAIKKQPIAASQVGWRIEPVLLPPGKQYIDGKPDASDQEIETELLMQLTDPKRATPDRYTIASKISFLRRFRSKKAIDISCLELADTRILNMPGELFIEYQLAAQAMRPGCFVCMAAYGEYSPRYIGTATSYNEGGYETSSTASMVGVEAEPILVQALSRLLDTDPAQVQPLGLLATHSKSKPIRIGIIGCDTSHVPAFADAFADPNATGDLAGFQVVAAYPGGSADIPSSIDRVPMYTEHLEKMGVQIVDNVESLLPLVDVVLLESLDGRKHLEQVRPVLKAGKRVFVDKPVAGSLADALKIFALSEELSVPLFTSSSLRFSPGIVGMQNDPRTGKVLGCDAYGPCLLEEHHPDLFWYGVHGMEILYTIMGPGCDRVSRSHTDGTDVAVGVWKNGRVGTFRGIRTGVSRYGATVFGDKGIAPSGDYSGYGPLVVEIAKFFKTGIPPVSAAESIEMFAFMEAADESKRQNGKSISIEETLQNARTP